MPPRDNAPTTPKMPMPMGGGARDDVMASIRASGGLKALKKVPDSQKNIRESPLGGSGGGSGGSGASSAAAASNPMAALQKALEERKKKVASNSGKWNIECGILRVLS